MRSATPRTSGSLTDVAVSSEHDRRVAVVTGGSRGIGAATAVALAASGHDLLMTFADRAHAAGEVADRCRDRGATVEIVQLDVADPAAVAAGFAVLDRVFGRLDVLVNDAASYRHRPASPRSLRRPPCGHSP